MIVFWVDKNIALVQDCFPPPPPPKKKKKNVFEKHGLISELFFSSPESVFILKEKSFLIYFKDILEGTKDIDIMKSAQCSK